MRPAASFRLTYRSQPSTGTGTLTSGSALVESLQGSFAAGQTLTGTGIAPGTTIVSVAANGTMTLSQAATADGNTVLSASRDATTAPLPFNAPAAQVQSALEGLDGIGAGNVTVSGGPGGAGGGSPYLVTFTGALAGVNVLQLSADAGELTGGAASATVDTTHPLRNLTLLAPMGATTRRGCDRRLRRRPSPLLHRVAAGSSSPAARR